MKKRSIEDETRRVVKHVLKTVNKFDHFGKAEFEIVLNEVIKQVHKNTRIKLDEIGQTVNKVITDMPNEYGQLNPSTRSWEALITYLYAKFLKELGRL